MIIGSILDGYKTTLSETIQNDITIGYSQMSDNLDLHVRAIRLDLAKNHKKEMTMLTQLGEAKKKQVVTIMGVFPRLLPARAGLRC